MMIFNPDCFYNPGDLRWGAALVLKPWVKVADAILLVNATPTQTFEGGDGI